MCWAEKFCLFVPLNTGCVALGVLNIIIATCMAGASIVHFSSDIQDPILKTDIHFQSTFTLELSKVSLDIVYWVILVVALLWILFSLMLLLGIFRNNSSFILAYFFYAILLIMFCQLSALLVMLKGCWLLSLLMFIASIIHIHFSVAVYTVYELMQKGKDFRFHKKQDDDDSLLTEQDFNPY